MLAKRLTSMVFALALLVDGTSASGDDIAPKGRSPGASASMAIRPERQREYYGWQVIAADVASLLVGLAMPDGGHGAIIGVTGYALGGPVIHALHGNNGTAVASLGLRLGLPLAGGLMGGVVYDYEHEEEDFDVLEYLAVGVVLGTATAALVDWAVLGWTDEHAPRPAEPKYVLVPQVAVGENGMSLGVLGRF